MSKKWSFVLSEYVLHGHHKDKSQFNYAEMLETLASKPSQERIVEQKDSEGRIKRSVVIEAIVYSSPMWLVEFVQVDGVENVEIWNPSEGVRIRSVDLPGQIAKRGWILLDPEGRRLHHSRSKNHIPLSEMMSYLEEVAQAKYRANLSLKFTPAIDESFMESVLAYDIIRKLNITILEPNYDWFDANDLKAQAQPSDASKVAIEYEAAHGGTLNKNAGVVPSLTAEVKKETPSISGIKAEVRNEGDAGTTTLSDKNSLKKRLISIPLMEIGRGFLTVVQDAIRG